jgi:hypothetical protein
MLRSQYKYGTCKLAKRKKKNKTVNLNHREKKIPSKPNL